jgi:hypothetical protein
MGIAAMWRGLLLTIGICAAAWPVLASSRYYCAADDANLKLSIDTGFSDDPGHKLNHFRGAMIGKSADIPAAFRTLMLDSSQLTQTWANDGELRLAITAFDGDGDAASTASAELVIMASGKAAAAPMAGTYALTLTAAGTTKPKLLKGPLTCNAK